MKKLVSTLVWSVTCLLLACGGAVAQSDTWMDETQGDPEGYGAWGAKQNEGEGEGEVLEFSTTLAEDIPPGESFSTFLTVPVDVTISAIRVFLDINHPDAWGMTFILVPPQGLPVTLASSATGVQGGFDFIIFSDSATASIASSSPPFVGYYRPATPLSTLNGRSSLGDWELQITDYAATDIGTLNSWGIALNEAAGEGEGEGEAEGEAEGESEGEQEDVVTVTPATVTLKVGETQTLSATSTNSSDRLFWSSSANRIATVDSAVYSNGTAVVTAVSPGSATITATGSISQKSDTAAITVTDASGVTVTPKAVTLQVGETKQFTATSSNTSEGFTWLSSTPTIARVDSTGMVTAVSMGLATIRATGKISGASDTATVLVEENRLRRWLWPVLGIFVPLGVLQLVEADPCFIATAAYGTPMAHEVNILRVFRDTFLLSNSAGTAFVDLYYQLSPPLAAFIAVHPACAAVVRVLLAPVVLAAYLMLACPGLPALLLLALCGWWFRRRRKTRMG